MKKRFIYFSIILSCGITFLGCAMDANKINKEGINNLKEKNYTSALSKFNEALDKDNNNVEATNLKKLTEDCISLKDKYSNNQFSSVIENYDKIKNEPNFNFVSNDIDEIYNNAKKKPSLKLEYLVYGSEEFVSNKYYADGKGELVLGSNKKSDLDNSSIIDITRPASEVLFQIDNSGLNPAEDIVLNLKFNNMAIKFEPTNPKWKGISNIHGLGLWNEIRFTQSGEPLYKDMPLKFTLYFSEAHVYSDANIEVTLAAKDCEAKKFNIPVKVK